MIRYLRGFGLVFFVAAAATAAKYDPIEEIAKGFSPSPPTDEHGRPMKIIYRVNFTSIFLHSVDLDYVHLNIRYTDQFRNPNLSWTSEDSNLTVVPVSKDRIFVPPLLGCEGMRVEALAPARYTVSMDGEVTSRQELTLRINCKSDYSSFPFDSHTCRACVETSHQAGEIELQLFQVEATPIYGLTEFRFGGNLIFIRNEQYFEGGSCISEETVEFVIVRKPEVYIWMLYLPTLIIYATIICAIVFKTDELIICVDGLTACAATNQSLSALLARTGRVPGLAMVTTVMQAGAAALALLLACVRMVWADPQQQQPLLALPGPPAPPPPPPPARGYWGRFMQWRARNKTTIWTVIYFAVAGAVPIGIACYAWLRVVPSPFQRPPDNVTSTTTLAP